MLLDSKREVFLIAYMQEFNNVYVSGICGLNLCDYISACTANCVRLHKAPCDKCTDVLTVAKLVLDNGYCLLSEAFKTVSPEVKYTAEHATHKLLQMPLVSINIGEQSKGRFFAILMGKHSDTDYLKLSRIFNGLVLKQSSSDTNSTLEKSVVKLLLNISKSSQMFTVCDLSSLWHKCHSSP